jgi:hypothetical protein
MTRSTEVAEGASALIFDPSSLSGGSSSAILRHLTMKKRNTTAGTSLGIVCPEEPSRCLVFRLMF